MPEARKILVLGFKGLSSSDSGSIVKCIPWSSIGASINISDYHDIVVNAPASLAHAPSAVAYRETFESTSVFKHLHNEGRIFVVGDPRLTLSERVTRRVGAGEVPGVVTVPFLEWACLNIDWRSASGDTLEVRSSASWAFLDPYLERIQSWKYTARSISWNSQRGAAVLRELGDGGSGQITTIGMGMSVNRIGELIAFAVDYKYSPSKRPAQSWPGLYFLPRIGLSDEEALEILLQDVLGVHVSSPEPDWLSALVAPGQHAVEAEIKSKSAAIEHAQLELDGLLQKRNDLREPLRLLYDKGLTLQEPVWAVLEQLGGVVERPAEDGNEDGWLSKDLGTDTLEYVLEIKGTTRIQHDEEGQKQLHRWIERGIRTRQKKYKGLFIGNSSVDLDPADRNDPFGDQWIKNAKLFGFVALRAEELYEAYVANCAGNFDLAAFWNALATTVGPLSLKAFITANR